MAVASLKSNVATYTHVAKQLGTSISTVIRAFDKAIIPSIDTSTITAINVDETKFIPSIGTYQLVVIDSTTNDVGYMKSKETKFKVNVTWKTLMFSKHKLTDGW